MLTIHNRFCYFNLNGEFINPTEPVEWCLATEPRRKLVAHLLRTDKFSQ
jgi:hypothetical protein